MRLILCILLFAAQSLALETIWSYDSSATDTTYPTSDVQLATIPASDSVGYPVDGTVYIITPRLCTNTFPQGWYGNDQYAAYYSQGQYFSIIDTINQSEMWTFGFVSGGSTPFDWKDTVAVCKDQLFDQEWVTHPIDTFYRTTTFNTDTAYFLTPTCAYLGNDGCDSCAFIVFCDTTLENKWDTLKITRNRDWPHFYQVEWFVRQLSQSDSFYFDTLRYVTEGDTAFYANRVPVTVTGTTSTGTVAVTGWRSAGMDVYAGGAKVVSAVDSLEYGQVNVPFSFNWIGLQPSQIESLQVWGISSNGESSDTTTIRRRYLRINDGRFIPR